MRITEEGRERFLGRKIILQKAQKALKKEFVGLDDIIDEIINNIEAWYLFPEGQVRPTIINLWGLTGVGKTALIQSLFKHLDMDNHLYKFNVGDYSNNESDKLSHVFTGKMKNKANQQIGIVFDEFQLGRTIDEMGAEIKQSGLRVIWDLLDSGQDEYLDL